MIRLLILCVFGAFGARAEALFTANNKPVPKYDQIVRKLKSGDRVSFGDGRSFQLGKFLGEGKTARIFEIEGMPGKVIRIPSYAEISPHELSFSGPDYIRFYVEGYAPLLEAGISVPKMYNHYKDQYVVMEHIGQKGLIPLADFLTQDPPPREVTRMSEELRHFARATAAFAHIGDFSEEQIAYDIEKHRWVLLDWINLHDRIEDVPQSKRRTPFSTLRDYAVRGYSLPPRMEPMSDWATDLIIDIEKDLKDAQSHRLSCKQALGEAIHR